VAVTVARMIENVLETLVKVDTLVVVIVVLLGVTRIVFVIVIEGEVTVIWAEVVVIELVVVVRSVMMLAVNTR
jgi:hypothetical protein